jgi:GPH family glycoside/pentoside/hexuronide:cation symporter
LAVAYYFLWSPPSGLGDWGLFFYLTVTYLLTYTFWTVFSIPYSSLGAEMTMDYHERTRLVGVREIFGVSGTIVATFVMAPQVATRIFGDLRVGYSTLAIWAGVVSAALILFAFFGVKEKPEFQHRETVPLRKSVRLVFKNRAFRRLLLAFVIHLIGGAFIPILVLYIQDYVIKVQIAQWIILTYLCCTMVSIPIWTRLSGRMGKKKAWSYSLVFISVVAAASMYYHEGTWLTWYIFAAMAGFGAGAAPAIAPSMMADVIDLDELESGTRREGAYFGMWAFVDKSAIGVASFIGMGTLGALGYDGHLEAQSDSVWWALKILYSVLPAICNGWAYFLLRGYPIDEKEHERIRAEIEAKKSLPATETA